MSLLELKTKMQFLNINIFHKASKDTVDDSEDPYALIKPQRPTESTLLGLQSDKDTHSEKETNQGTCGTQ